MKSALTLLVMTSLLLSSVHLITAQWSSTIGWGGAGGGKRSSDVRTLLGIANSQSRLAADQCIDSAQLEMIGNLALAAAERVKQCNARQANLCQNM